ncbi:putative membrane protein (TIGR02226 family) [Winogradskyella wandonensis]|uniref:Putative membrane protein (TIGR02226 family) n=1 Tax=Winogradskyella wandonensis TaxID=1442586 RepID=A0A4R1KVR8_9FLAO|nr:BatA domain-containing protein [Winogradskyella wandonensis]TCK69234.1 putative membrane protein (TIGR02226 family) [Winogradskyella wandonensis]
MQFKHPELLWALLLLLIPIIVHLFQLRRFQKVAFTNVKFLKNVELQTRKSSQIKKWFTLITRLLLLACIILAFAQPFTTNSDTFNTKNETVIYLDNSFSMEAKGNNGSLLNEAIQDIIKSYSDAEELTIFTNTETFRNTSVKAITNDLIKLKHSTQQLSYNSAYLKGKQYFSKDKSSTKNLILVSDFQQKEEPLEFEGDSTISLKLVQPKAIYTNNISIDSIYVLKLNPETIDIGVDLLNSGTSLSNVSVALNNDDVLVAKTAVDLNQEASTTFSIPNNTVFNGSVVVEDTSLQYDNVFYFNINANNKIKVLSINEASDAFLKKLYTPDEFVYASVNYNAIDYSQIESQNLIILNELKTIPNALVLALKAFKNDGGSIAIIPSNDANLNAYNQLFTSISIPEFNEKITTEKRLTTINYDHPLINDAFYNRVANFQYPIVNTSFGFSSISNAVYRFSDGSPFLLNSGKTYTFTAALNEDNGNFKKSPLIVPVLYNMAKKSLEIPKLYYQTETDNIIDINIQLPPNDILTLTNGNSDIIPLQQTFSKKVSLFTNEFPKTAGILDVTNKNEILKKLSFNYPREESQLVYYNLKNNRTYAVETSLVSAIETIKSNASINALWKWFVIFALCFLIIEMLILKYLK